MRKSFFTILFSILFALSGCSSNSEPVSKSGFYFDTVITITIYDNDKSELLDEAFKLCSEYEKLFSRTIEGSDISKLNISKSSSELDDDTINIINSAIKYSELTDGAFDITCASITELWGFGSDNASIPTLNELDNALSKVSYKNISVTDNKITLSNDASVDLGGIAKGFIADKLKEFLLENDVDSALIDLGGNILEVGAKAGDKPFNIGIRKPFGAGSETIVTVRAKDKSIVTSGCYERYFEQDEQLFHHIIDPKTGYPVDNNLFAVTIISDKSIDGDALSTACYVLGYDKALDLINSLEDIEAIFITNEYEILLSDGLSIDNANVITLKNE